MTYRTLETYLTAGNFLYHRYSEQIRRTVKIQSPDELTQNLSGAIPNLLSDPLDQLNFTPSQHIGFNEPALSVSQLNSLVKSMLVKNFPVVVVEGEISNFRSYSTGHWYFSLKDQNSALNCTMFANRASSVKFQAEDGVQVQIRGKLSIYEKQGKYQAIVEYMEPLGEGALRLAFERLKVDLQTRGWFDPKLKKPCPPFPKNIAIISSIKAAARQDVYVNIYRRFPIVNLVTVPTAVQGRKAVTEIVAAIQRANILHPLPDVAILTRGGGSMEDLEAFNTETVAKAIYESSIPIVSAVGHDIDYTIADFVADLRAATPSTAAEMVTPDQNELRQTCDEFLRQLERVVTTRLSLQRQRLSALRSHLQKPRVVFELQHERVQQNQHRLKNHLRNLLETMLTRNNNASTSLMRTLFFKLNGDQNKLTSLRERLRSPWTEISERKSKISQLQTRLHRAMMTELKTQQHNIQYHWYRLSKNESRTIAKTHQIHTKTLFDRLCHKLEVYLQQQQSKLSLHSTNLNSVSPLAVMERGYAVVGVSDGSKYGNIVRSVAQVKKDDHLLVHVADGKIVTSVNQVGPRESSN